jgi:hypothetical protein
MSPLLKAPVVAAVSAAIQRHQQPSRLPLQKTEEQRVDEFASEIFQSLLPFLFVNGQRFD